MSNNDKGSLIGVLKKTRTIFDETLKKELKGLPLEKQFNDAHSEIENSIRKAINDLENESDQNLISVGLSGKQLQLKLSGFNNAYTIWQAKRTNKILLSLLKWLNIILGSLAAIIPIIEPIKEYKECLENHIAENLDGVN